MNRLAKISQGELLASGIFPGLIGEGAPLWSDGENITFEDGGVRKSHGLLGLADLSAIPTGAKSTVAEGEARLYLGAGTSAYMYRSADVLTPIANLAAVGGAYQFIPWDTQALINNQVDPVQLWPNVGLAAPITAPFTRAKVLFKYQTQAFAANTSNGGQLVEWSSANSVTDWTPSLTNTAGNLRLRDLEGDIEAAVPIGGSVGIYGQKNAGLFSFIGGGAVTYGFRRPVPGISAINPYSVVGLGDRHYGLTKDRAFVTDMLSYQNIDEPAMRSYLLANADWDRQAEVRGWHDWRNNRVRWAVPKISGGMFGLGYRVDARSWTRFDDGVILGEEAGAFNNMFLLNNAKLLREDPLSYDNDGSAMTAFVRTKPLDLGDRNRMKRITKLSLDMTWTGEVEIRLGYSNHLNDAVDWVVTAPAANEIYPDSFGVQSETAYLSVEIRATSVGATWKLAGGEIYGEVTGYVS